MQLDINEAKHPSANPLTMDEKPHPSEEHQPVATPGPNKPESKKEQRLHRFEEKVTKVTDPINRLSVSAGCESFLPLPLEEECRKAARIITSLSACKFTNILLLGNRLLNRRKQMFHPDQWPPTHTKCTHPLSPLLPYPLRR